MTSYYMSHIYDVISRCLANFELEKLKSLIQFVWRHKFPESDIKEEKLFSLIQKIRFDQTGTGLTGLETILSIQIPTGKAFDPWSPENWLRPIAERFNLDADAVLNNIVYARAHSRLEMRLGTAVARFLIFTGEIWQNQNVLPPCVKFDSSLTSSLR